MIISHKHRFIFIKTRKTAGTSIEISLSRYCGKDDVITPITPADEVLRGVFGMAAQNYLSVTDGSDRSVIGRPLRRTLLQAASRLELSRPGTVPEMLRRRLANHRGTSTLQAAGHYYNHMTAAEVIRLAGEDVWNSYYRFCFERDPVSKVVSDYRYRASGRTFEEYLQDFPLPIDYEKYYLNGQLVVDFVGRHESLIDDLRTALARVGIAFDGWLPRAKAFGSGRPAPTLTASQESMVRERMRAGLEAVTQPSRRESSTI